METFLVEARPMELARFGSELGSPQKPCRGLRSGLSRKASPDSANESPNRVGHTDVHRAITRGECRESFSSAAKATPQGTASCVILPAPSGEFRATVIHAFEGERGPWTNRVIPSPQFRP